MKCNIKNFVLEGTVEEMKEFIGIKNFTLRRNKKIEIPKGRRKNKLWSSKEILFLKSVMLNKKYIKRNNNFRKGKIGTIANQLKRSKPAVSFKASQLRKKMKSSIKAGQLVKK